MLLLQLGVVAARRSSNCDHIVRSVHRNALNTNFFTPHVSFLLHVTCAVSSQSSLFNPLLSSVLVTLLQPPVHSSLKITNCSFQHAAPHLWNMLPPTLQLPYQFDPSSSPSSSPSSLSVQCNAWHWTDIMSLECMSVCLSVCITVHPL